MKMNDLGEKFSDIGYYNKQMSLGMVDKLFFVDRIPNNKNYTFVDFGCADGTLISHLYEIYGDKCSYIGYDASEEMIEFAKTKFQWNSVDNVVFTTSWEDVKLRLLHHSSETVLILSSVIHEVYSYAKGPADILTFWERVLNSRFKYIVVRDMMLSSSSVSRESSSEAVRKVEANPTYSKQLGEFEAVWGSIRNNRNLLHFLLKYRWKINWKREVNENYFPILIEEFLTKVESGLKNSYRLDYFEKFRIKFLEEQIQKDFGITIEDTTHIKAVFILEEIELPF